VVGAKGIARNIGLLARGQVSTSGPTEEFWALNAVDFEINRGEAVGIIGRNGAGKSTLLKILSRITEPTTGRIELNGRVASLLEVGTGFHPELTGRENIYLNGAIIGMTRAEIRRKFEEIVDFAGVEKFLDTPVKRYSSGMGVRLGFAVAAHLEPEILIVDEVLAVGDAEFQKKCLGKMNDVAGEGRTVLFVSHNLDAVQALCGKGILLKNGNIAGNGPMKEIVDKYMDTGQVASNIYQSSHDRSHPHIAAIVVHDAQNNAKLNPEEPISIEFTLSEACSSRVALGVHIYRKNGECVLHLSDEFSSAPAESRKRTLTIPRFSLAPGAYSVSASISIRNIAVLDAIENSVNFEVDTLGKLKSISTGAWLGFASPALGEWVFD